jgi:hypothetical protein
MAARGLVYSDPIAVTETLWPDPRPSPHEITIATADTGCKAEVGLVAVYRTELDAVTATEEVTLTELVTQWREIIAKIVT